MAQRSGGRSSGLGGGSSKNGRSSGLHRTVIHVTPRAGGKGGWAVKEKGTGRASSVKPTQQEAIDAAKRTAKQQQPSQVVIHRRNNRILKEHTYPRSSDPHPPKG